MARVPWIISDMIGGYARMVWRFICKIPKLIWAGSAVVGVLFLGFLGGFWAATDPSLSELTTNQALLDQNNKYAQLIIGYEDLTDLYRKKDAEATSILDPELDHQEEYEYSLSEIERFKDLINIQMGRILELRRQANFPDIDFNDSTYQKETL